MDDYDPEALPVETARRVIRSLVTPVTASERVAVRASLGRVVGADVVSTLNVPAHDNSAMDGFAVCGADLKKDGDTVLHEIGTAFAGRVFGAAVGPGKCVRVMTSRSGASRSPRGDSCVRRSSGSSPRSAWPR
jgi:molybdopterin molybdotransferase